MKETIFSIFLKLPMYFSEALPELFPKPEDSLLKDVCIQIPVHCTVSLRKCSENCTLIAKVQFPGFWCTANSQQAVFLPQEEKVHLSPGKCDISGSLFQTDSFPWKIKLSFVVFVPFTERPAECPDTSLHHTFIILQKTLLLSCLCSWSYIP